MATSPNRPTFASPVASDVHCTDRDLIVHIADGRTLSVPLTWFPRLNEGTPEERAQWELIGDGEGIHWPMLDEDIAVEHLLEGRRSGEGTPSLDRWRAWLEISRKERT